MKVEKLKLMRLGYTPFKIAFDLNKLSITDYINVVYNEASKIEEVGCYVVNKTYLNALSSSTTIGKRFYLYAPDDFSGSTIARTIKSIYTQNFKTISDGRIYQNTRPFDIYNSYDNGRNSIIFNLPYTWSDDECKNYLNGIKIFYKKAYLELDWIESINGKYYDIRNGVLSDAALCTAKKADVSKYVGQKLEFHRSTSAAYAGIVFFNNNNQFISGVKFTGNYQEVTIPGNAKYLGYDYYNTAEHYMIIPARIKL